MANKKIKANQVLQQKIALITWTYKGIYLNFMKLISNLLINLWLYVNSHDSHIIFILRIYYVVVLLKANLNLEWKINKPTTAS